MAVVGMTANPFGAYQINRHMADREVVHFVGVLVKWGVYYFLPWQVTGSNPEAATNHTVLPAESSPNAALRHYDSWL